MSTYPKIRNGRAAFWICSVVVIGFCSIGRTAIRGVLGVDDQELGALRTSTSLAELGSRFEVLNADLKAMSISGEKIVSPSISQQKEIQQLVQGVDLGLEPSSEVGRRFSLLKPVINTKLRRAQIVDRMVHDGDLKGARVALSSPAAVAIDRELFGRITTLRGMQSSLISELQVNRSAKLQQIDTLFVLVLIASVSFVWAFAFLDDRLTRRSIEAVGNSDRLQLLEQIAAGNESLVYVYNLREGSYTYINGYVTALLGWTTEQVSSFGRNVLGKLAHPDDAESLGKHILSDASPSGNASRFEARLLHSDSTYRWFSVRESVFARDLEGAPLEVLGVASDITEQRERERAITTALESARQENSELRMGHERLQAERTYFAEAAGTDALTGLSNLRTLRRKLEAEFQTSRVTDSPLCVLMVDLDDFKMVNDRYGHSVGDEVLKRVAELLRRAVRGEDCAARYGGEEFAIICPGTSSWQGRQLAERLRRSVEGMVLRDIRLTVSVGIANSSRKIHTPQLLLDQADQNLYEAKRLGKNRVCYSIDSAKLEVRQ